MMALVMPSRQAFLPEVVGMNRLMNAIPLQTAGMNLMQIIGPAVGGPLIDWIGPGSVYSIMAVMYAMSVLTLGRFLIGGQRTDLLQTQMVAVELAIGIGHHFE